MGRIYQRSRTVICQSVTELAVELDAPIGTDDFRTLNRCLDDAIAGAVTEHAQRENEVLGNGGSKALLALATTAFLAFDNRWSDEYWGYGFRMFARDLAAKFADMVVAQ